MKKSIPFLISLILLYLIGCKQNDPFNDNEFNDLTGLQFTLEWSLSNSTGDPIDGANLDLELTYNGSIVEESNRDFSFETVELRQSNPNGNYNLNVYYYQGDVPIDYTITVQGLSSSKVTSYNGSFTPDYKGGTYSLIQITKNGDNYQLF